MRKKSILFFLFIIVVIVIQVLVYNVINYVDVNADTNLIQRNIETPSKMILNGYLGLFFGFKYLGNLNFLLIPLGIIYFSLFKTSLSKGAKMLLVFFVISFILIALKGYFNPRYQLTLLPFTLFFVLFFSYKIISKYYPKSYLYFTYVLLLISVFYNFYKQVFEVRFQEKLNSVLKVNDKENKSDEKGVDEIENIFTVINSLKTNSSILVNNLPDFYLQSNKNGTYFWCGDEIYYGKSGRARLFSKNDTDEFIHKKIINELKCKFIYTYVPYEKYNETFDRFLKNRCTLLAKDKEKRLLYQIHDVKK